MKNCLIIADNNANVVNLINFFACKKLDIKILGITLSIEKSINIIKENKVDMIIIDYSNNRFDLRELFSELEKMNSTLLKKSIIVINDDNKLKAELESNKYINAFLIKPVLYKELYKIIIKMFNTYNSKDLYQSILNELSKLSFKTKYAGTKYMGECIYEVFISGKYYEYSFFNEILPIIAKRYNKSEDSIYGNIKQSIKKMTNVCDQDVIVDYFKFCEFERPKPKQIIDRVIENIKK
ncbi:MAG: hypothetical protein IKJ36_01075 [Clostridia bacterium]|nr:hypothetical protein [Clostridia bacterium]